MIPSNSTFCPYCQIKLFVECPKCGSEFFDCNDMESNPSIGKHWDYCYCEDCGAEFSVEYDAIEIVASDD